MGVRVLAAIAVTLNESKPVRNYSWCLARRERLGKQSWLASVLQPLAGSEPSKAAVAVFIRAVGPPPDAILALQRGPVVFLIILPLTSAIISESLAARQPNRS